MDKNIKSHIYLAESILNRFAYRDKDNRKIIDYIDLENMKIDSCTTRSFNTMFGYYTNENEEALKRKSEDKIGGVIRKLEKNRTDGNIEFRLSVEEKNIIKKYLAYQWIRNDSIIQILNKELEFGIDARILKNVFIENEEEHKYFITCTFDLDMIIFFNNTNVQYIINSSSSTINSSSEKYYIINMVLTPNILISFCKKGSIKKYLNLDTDCIIKLVPSTDAVMDCNIHTLNVAYREEPHFVVGRKRELEATLKFYKDILEYKSQNK